MKTRNPNFEPYEGKEPYIYASYSHKDIEVIDDLEMLNELGFRIWYDIGIQIGLGWEKSIEDHLKRCKTLMIFASKNSLESDIVFAELTIAQKIRKDKDGYTQLVILPIFLDNDIKPTDFIYLFLRKLEFIDRWKFSQYKMEKEYHNDLQKLLTRMVPETKKTHELFISYAKEDKERIEPLVNIFKEQGWGVWWDPEIPPGKRYDEVIEDALEQAKCVIVIWSEASVNSWWVKTESAEANQREILVPVQLDALKIPLEFRQIQTAQLIGWNGDKNYMEVKKLLKSISKIVDN